MALRDNRKLTTQFQNRAPGDNPLRTGKVLELIVQTFTYF